ncbi:hypothetical protein L615_005200000210 [Nocardioides sp. J9]|nr:hypothetical protein L615_005200000210 [Nocardioides sp. J9]
MVLGHRSDVLGRGHRLGCLGRAVVAAALAATLAAPALALLAVAAALVAPLGLHRQVVDDQPAALAVRAGLAERLQETGADPLAGHLDQAERGDLGDLVAGPVTAQALDEAAQHQVAVGLEDHVDEVDDDDAADVAQPELAHDLLGRLEVVLGDGLLEVAAGAGELAGVDVDDGHRLGAVDDQRATGGQPDLAVEALGDLLVDPVRREDVGLVVAGLVVLEPVGQVGGDVVDVLLDRGPRLVALDDEPGEVLGEQVADDLEGQVRLAVEQLRGVALGDTGLDVLPAGLEPLDVAGQLLLGGTLGGGADDHAGGVGDDLLEQGLEPRALGVGQLAGDPRRGAVGDVDEEAAGQADLAGQARTLVADRVLGDLDQHGLARLQDRLDLAGLAVLVAQRGPVDLAGVQHGVPALADVDERGLHRGQHVLHPAEVDVADQRGLRLAGDVVLDEHLVLEHGDLGEVLALADRHDPLDRLAAGQELGLAHDRRAAAAGLAALAAALLLGLEAGGAGHRGDLVLGRARLAYPGDGVLRVVPGVVSPSVARPAAATAPARRAAALVAARRLGGVGVVAMGLVVLALGLVVAGPGRVAGLAGLAGGLAGLGGGGVLAVLALLAGAGGLAPAATATATAPARRTGAALGVVGVLGVVRVVGVVGVVGVGGVVALGRVVLGGGVGALVGGLVRGRSGLVDRGLGGGLGGLVGRLLRDSVLGPRLDGLLRLVVRGLLRGLLGRLLGRLPRGRALAGGDLRRLEDHGGRGPVGRGLGRRLGRRLGGRLGGRLLLGGEDELLGVSGLGARAGGGLRGGGLLRRRLLRRGLLRGSLLRRLRGSLGVGGLALGGGVGSGLGRCLLRGGLPRGGLLRRRLLRGGLLRRLRGGNLGRGLRRGVGRGVGGGLRRGGLGGVVLVVGGRVRHCATPPPDRSAAGVSSTSARRAVP